MTDQNERIVSLDALIEGDASSVEMTCKYLKRDGFIFLDMTGSDLLNTTWSPFQRAGEYLQGSARGSGSRTELHGHISSKYKDSFRFLTGNQYETGKSPVAGMDELVQAMDETAIEIAEVLAKPVFQLDGSNQVGALCDLPLLDPEPRNQQAYGLIDIVSYHNDSPLTPEIVVQSHLDPGLFVLALPEMAPGLQLLSTTGEWVSPPPGMGVIWAGRASGKCGLVPCVHRVKRHETARVACWHEICTAGQISAPLLKHLEETDQQLALGNGLVGTDAVLDYLRRAEDHEQADAATSSSDGLPVSKTVQMRTETVDSAGEVPLSDVAELSGMPMSKVASNLIRQFKISETKEKRSANDFLRVEPAPEPVPSGLSSMKVKTTSVYFPVRKDQKKWFGLW